MPLLHKWPRTLVNIYSGLQVHCVSWNYCHKCAHWVRECLMPHWTIFQLYPWFRLKIGRFWNIIVVCNTDVTLSSHCLSQIVLPPVARSQKLMFRQSFWCDLLWVYSRQPWHPSVVVFKMGCEVKVKDTKFPTHLQRNNQNGADGNESHLFASVFNYYPYPTQIVNNDMYILTQRKQELKT